MNFNKPLFNDAFSNNWEEGDTEEVIQLVVGDEDGFDDDSHEITELDHLPLLVLKNTVLFPNVIIPVTLKHKQAIQLVEKMQQQSRPLGVVTQKSKKIKTF